MLTVEIPPSYEKERRYVLSVLLEEFLGLEARVQLSVRQDVKIAAGDGRSLVLADRLFATAQDGWLKKSSLPQRPLKTFDFSLAGLDARTVSPQIPVVYGRDPDDPCFFSASSHRIDLGLDVFGSAFFLLTRYEETMKSDKDEHGRFPSKASLAFQEGFLERPIVNEYVEILWACLKRLWPSMERRPRTYRVMPSHDVDSPRYYLFFPKAEIVGGMCGDIVKRRSPLTALKKLKSWADVAAGRAQDPFDTFEWIMDRSEQAGCVSAFNFMGGGSTKYDGPGYSLDHPVVQDLIRGIIRRGHEIGFHPSYATVGDAAAWNGELGAVRGAAQGAVIRGGRQHYLRFEAPATWCLWDDAGLEYDSTLLYADHAGFRCGTCYEFSVFDPKRREHLRLKERPTVVMDGTVTSRRYMGLGTGSVAYDFIFGLKERCRLFDGDFTVLWHNSALADSERKELYGNILK
jgi:hypothetical protein